MFIGVELTVRMITTKMLRRSPRQFKCEFLSEEDSVLAVTDCNDYTKQLQCILFTCYFRGHESFNYQCSVSDGRYTLMIDNLCDDDKLDLVLDKGCQHLSILKSIMKMWTALFE